MKERITTVQEEVQFVEIRDVNTDVLNSVEEV